MGGSLWCCEGGGDPTADSVQMRRWRVARRLSMHDMTQGSVGV
jgi:hypothetical protein